MEYFLIKLFIILNTLNKIVLIKNSKFIDSNLDSNCTDTDNCLDSITQPTSIGPTISDSCEPYYESSGISKPKINCPTYAKYCCGTCSNRYCCASINQRLDQTQCYETCKHYLISSLNLFEQKCDLSNKYCCGTCNNRFCCSDMDFRLDQTKCIREAQIERCNEYIDYNGWYNPPTECSKTFPFCCGTCNTRFCCSSNSSRLNQNICYMTTSRTSSTRSYYYYTTNPNAYWWLLAVAVVLFLFFFILIMLGKKKKVNITRNTNFVAYRRNETRRQNSNNNNRNQFNRENSVPAYHVSIYSNPVLFQNDDAPPAYDTLE